MEIMVHSKKFLIQQKFEKELYDFKEEFRI